MHSLIFSAYDLTSLRFAYSPLKEVVASVNVLRRPMDRALHLPWFKEVRPLLAEIDLALLGDLVISCPGYIPDFLTPAPATPIPDLTTELAMLRATPPSVVRDDLNLMVGPRRKSVAALYADPVAELDRLASAIETYWQVAFARHWPRMRNLLEGDLLYRVRRLADGGPALLFADLHKNVRWAENTLHVEGRSDSQSRVLDGQGLLLIPSVFVWPKTFSRTLSPGQPTLTYPARGLATLWEKGFAPDPGALAAVIGGARALILTELDSPLSTTELARRLPYSAGSISEHLSLLRAAGLVTAHRIGRSVLYARSAASESLLAGVRPALA
ncbi:DUF5937 family protein [Acrocarpospora sp. B8E8]